MTKYEMVGFAFAATAALACSDLNAPLYFQGTAFESMGGEMMLPTQGLSLRFREPTRQEQMQLDAERDARGYDADIPWVSRDKVHVEVSYKVTNISGTTAAFTLIVDGADQYTKYDTQMVSAALQQGANDPPVFLPLIPVVPHMLAPGQSFSSIVREDDFSEGELDLDALGRWYNADMADPTFAGVLINRSDVDAIGLGMVPGGTSIIPNTSRHKMNDPGLLVVPAMVEVDLRLKTDVAMRVEWFVRVRDDDDRLWHNDADPILMPDPTLFQPPAMM
jgi:hypothetical protein